MCSISIIFVHGLPQIIIFKIILVIIEVDRVNGSVGSYTLVVSHHLFCTINSNSNHYDIVSCFHGKLSSNSHGHQFLVMGISINFMNFTLPLDWVLIDMNIDPNNILSSLMSCTWYTYINVAIFAVLTFFCGVSGGSSYVSSCHRSNQFIFR